MAEYACTPIPITLCVWGGAVFITAVIITIVILKLCFLSAIITQRNILLAIQGYVTCNHFRVCMAILLHSMYLASRGLS